MQTQIWNLENGITCLFEPSVLEGIVITLWVRAGSISESQPGLGLAHCLEHLVFKATENYDGRQVVWNFERHGGSINAFTSQEFTVFSATVLKPYFRQAMDVLAEVIGKPLLQKDHLEQEKQVIIDEERAVQDTPDEKIQEDFFMRFWKGSPLSNPIAADEKATARITIEQARSFWNQYYQPQNILISIAGNLASETVFTDLNDTFGQLENRTELITTTIETPHYQSFQQIIHNDFEQGYCKIGLPVVSIQHPQSVYWELLDALFCDCMSSRLFQKLREEKNLVYAVDSALEFCGPTGAYAIDFHAQPGNVGLVCQLITEEIVSLSETLNQAEFEMAQEYVKGHYIINSQANASLSYKNGYEYFYFQRPFELRRIIQQIDACSLAEMQSIVKEYFQIKHFSLLAYVPKKVSKKSLSTIRLGG